jgi:cytoskeletal protein CcmA (bactofilin family)
MQHKPSSAILGFDYILSLPRVGGDWVNVDRVIDRKTARKLRQLAAQTGEIRTKSVKVRGTVEGNLFVTERCELQAGCKLHGDIEAPRLMVDENATFLGSAKVGTVNSLPA